MSGNCYRFLVCSIVALTALSTAPGVAAPARIKLATLAPKDSSFHNVLKEMGQKWRSAPGGGVNLQIYTDGTMGGEADMVRRMRAGQIQAAMLTVVGLSEIDDSVAALNYLPMLFRSMDEVDYVRQQLRADLERRFLAKGFVVLFWGDAGWVHFFTRRQALTPDEFKQLKLFVWAGDAKTLDLWKQYGFQPVPLEIADTLTALNTGLVDAVCTLPSYALAGQFYQQTPHLLALRWAPLVGGTVISKKAWDALPDVTRQEMLKTAAEAGIEIQTRSRQENQEAIEAMKKRGLIVHEPTEAIESAWRDLAERAYPQIRGTLVPAELFDQVLKLVKEYRAKAAEAKPQ